MSNVNVRFASMRKTADLGPNIKRTLSFAKEKLCEKIVGPNLRRKVSENVQTNKAIWIDGGTHAREWITPATVTYIINKLMTDWEDNPDFIRDKTWYFMPVVNPDGYDYSRRVDRLWRKNRTTNKDSECRGVDINRNFNIGWNTGSSSANPCSEIYQGEAPISENESQAIVTFLKKKRQHIKAFLTMHSYSQMFLYPYGHKVAKYKHSNRLHTLGTKVAKIIKEKTGQDYRVGARHELLPLAGGGIDDWASSALKARYIYTIELRDRGYYGFILPANQIIDTAFEGYVMVAAVASNI